MTIGRQPTADSLDGEITNVANMYRDAATAGGRLAQAINKLGTAGLAALSPPVTGQDAADMLTFAGRAANLSQVFYGTGSASNFDFDDAFTSVYGG